MSVHRKPGEVDARIRDVVRQMAFDWIVDNEVLHVHNADGTLNPLTTFSNDFVMICEGAYYEAIRESRWEPDELTERLGTEKFLIEDVCNHIPDDGVFCVYAHMDIHDNVIYVGKSAHFRKRQSAHRNSSPWWREIQSIEVVVYDNDFDMSLAETMNIRNLRPRYNIADNPDRDY